MLFPDDSVANEAGTVKTGVGDQSLEPGALNHRAEPTRPLHQLLGIAVGRGRTEMRSRVTRGGGGWKENWVGVKRESKMRTASGRRSLEETWYGNESWKS